MGPLPDFRSTPGTLGVELEWQLINTATHNLSDQSQLLIERMQRFSHLGKVKPEITSGMIEFNSSVHSSYQSLLNELQSLRSIITAEAHSLQLALCGGGNHLFQRWQEQHIYPQEPFISDYNKFGYLAKQYTVFGQHIHIGCKDGDEAIYLCHALARYLPQLIVLAASSPFYLGEDTGYDSTRLNSISVFPLSGTLPWVTTWDEFKSYTENLIRLKVIEEISDFYWDIRPKPEFGTIEIRICDTPLTVEHAARLTFYAQLLVKHILENRPAISPDIYLPYALNRFYAARHGYKAAYIDPQKPGAISIQEDILNTCAQLLPHAIQLGHADVLQQIIKMTEDKFNDAEWLRLQLKNQYTMPQIVKNQITRWEKSSETLQTEKR